MRCIRGISKSAFFNFACEEYFMNNFKEPMFLLWENDNCVMVGKNQNTYAEVNIDYVKEHKIEVVRRQSGGGTIYTSQGIIQFSFITKNTDAPVEEKMKEFAMPLVNYLQSIGVNAEFSGRNDIQIDGLKISGNAQAYSNNIMLHHGSILFDADLTHATNALTPKKEKLDAKGVKSVRSRMTLIRRHLLNDMTPNEFFNGFFDYVCDTHDNMVETPLTDDEISQINEIQTSKWNTWEWNYGKNPKANFNKTKKFKGGLVEVNAVISKGRIEEINIFGDFFGKKDKDELEQLIVGNKHAEESLRAILTTSDINQYLSNITMDELMEVLF